ncbi:MAG: hypothetical protein M1834_008210 [Cirrosporium novae-zelandiae]|nr:MAG: hypothetical protein M1834_008210 [Cirrosporium novae-zelandiae]
MAAIGNSLREALSKAKGRISSPRGSPRSSPRTSTDTVGSREQFSSSRFNSLDSDRSELYSSSDDLGNDEGSPMSKSQKRKHNHRKSREMRRLAAEERERDLSKERRRKDEEARKLEPPEMQARYGFLPLVSEEQEYHRDKVDQITIDQVGQEVTLRARIHSIRRMSAKLVFFVLRQQILSIQGVLEEHQSQVSEHMVQWAEKLPTGTVVIIKGLIQKPHEPVKACTVHDAEVVIRELHVVAARTDAVPFDVQEAEMRMLKGEDESGHTVHINLRTRLANRVLDLRTSSSQAIFRINAAVGSLFRQYLDSQGFMEIHSPKLQGGATEGGASVFEVKYFGRPAFLAQSPQLAKQMCISADFERVYEIGPVFRAENSNTHRHLTEYTGLDLEMAIEEDYHEALRMIDATLKYVYKGVYDRFQRELETVGAFYPDYKPLTWLDETLVLSFHEGIQLLRDSGWKDDNGNEPSYLEDLSTRSEIRLGQLVKEKYNTDYYILDKFPTSARPFYTMPDPHDPNITNSFDIFLRGQEILSGGQRIHDADVLEANIIKAGMNPKNLEEYLEAFRWGMPRHAGGGIGLERVVMLLLCLGDVRLGSLFPRDPKSFPPGPPPPKLRHLEASTLNPPWENKNIPESERELQPLEKLIANYGSSTNTSWYDERCQIWRDPSTGAAIAYVPMHRYALMPGDPLCDESQYAKVIQTFLKWLKKELRLKPVWLLVSKEVEEVLGAKMGWKSFSCVAEQTVDPSKNAAEEDSDLGRKIRHAQRGGVKIVEIPFGEPVPEDIRQKCDERIQDWLNNRHGTQVRLSSIIPWRDMEHRRYWYALDKDGKICSLVILAQLSVKHGWQVKYSLDFPGAPNGTIEYITIHAMNAVAHTGATTVTFGGGASSKLTSGHNMTGVKVRVLEKSYKAIAANLHLIRKTEFRQKLGATEDLIYICYPPGGLGPHGIKAILEFFEDE